MSVKKRGEFYHFDFTINGQRFRGSTQLRSKTSAREFEDRERQRAALGEARAVPTLQAVAAQWFETRVEGSKSVKTTAIRVKIALRLIGPATLVSEIGPPEIEAAIIARRHEVTRQTAKGKRKPPSNATVNRDLIDTTMRPILRYAGRVMKAPVQSIDWRDLRLPEPKGRTRSFSRDEVRAWREGFPHWHRQVFGFCMTYGVRLTEAFFPLSAYDPETGYIAVRERKNGLTHTIRLTSTDNAAMAARYSRAVAGKLKTIWFKETKRGLRAITARGFQSASRSALDGAGIGDARAVHDMRHHAATAFLRAPGANLKKAQRVLGHENIQSTARYAHVADEDVFDVLEQMQIELCRGCDSEVGQPGPDAADLEHLRTQQSLGQTGLKGLQSKG